jgi:hypothetical protein
MQTFPVLSMIFCFTFGNKNICPSAHLTATFTTTDVTSKSGTANPSGAHECSPIFSGVRVVRSSVFCALFWRLLLVYLSFFFWPLRCLCGLLSFANALTVLLRFTTSDYPFAIINLFVSSTVNLPITY